MYVQPAVEAECSMLYILFLCMCRIMRPSKDVAVAVILLISVRIHCTANAITKTVQKMQCHFGGCVVIERLQQHKQTLLITLTRHKGHSNYCTNFNCLMNIQIKAHLPVTNQTNHIHSLSTGFPFIRNSGKVGADT